MNVCVTVYTGAFTDGHIFKSRLCSSEHFVANVQTNYIEMVLQWKKHSAKGGKSIENFIAIE